MANEINMSVSMTATKNGASVGASAGFNDSMAGSEMIASVQEIPNSWTAISFGGCDDVNSATFKSLGANGDLNVGNILFATDNAGAHQFASIKPGQAILLKNPPLAIYAKTSADTIDLLVCAAES